jgi:hypothetical protein
MERKPKITNEAWKWHETTLSEYSVQARKEIEDLRRYITKIMAQKKKTTKKKTVNKTLVRKQDREQEDQPVWTPELMSECITTDKSWRDAPRAHDCTNQVPDITITRTQLCNLVDPESLPIGSFFETDGLHGEEPTICCQVVDSDKTNGHNRFVNLETGRDEYLSRSEKVRRVYLEVNIKYI